MRKRLVKDGSYEEKSSQGWVLTKKRIAKEATYKEIYLGSRC